MLILQKFFLIPLRYTIEINQSVSFIILNSSNTTFLNAGQKYEMAGKFGVKVVSKRWFVDSINKKFCQDHNKYPVKKTEES